MWKKLIRPQAAIVTVLVFVLIGLLSFIRVNVHFLDPFSHGIKDYEVTDIVYSRMRDLAIRLDERIVVINTGDPDRAQIARMLERIATARPAVIGIDVLFSERKDPAVDSALQAAIKGAGNVVLATFLEGYSEHLGYFQAETLADTFFSNYAHTGFANFPGNETQTIRFFSPREKTKDVPVNSFAVEVARQYQPAAAERLFRRKKAVERIHYTAVQENFVVFEPAAILDTSFHLEQLQGKIVLMGYVNGPTERGYRTIDRFFTPFNQHYTGRSLPDMDGLIIHANIVKMVLDGQYIQTVPPLLSFLLAVLYCYGNIILLERLHHRYHYLYHPMARLVQIAEFALLFFIISALFYYFRIKWDFSLGMFALLLSFDVLVIYEGVMANPKSRFRKIPGLFSAKSKKRVTKARTVK
jgi:CHASE2 domain-containing sensor protein